jgi:MoaA/NifB/PqqE/SkfB family radical SAM enzyme
MIPTPKESNDIKHIRLAIDDSCNLRCPSCRNGLIFHKEGSAYRLGIKLADRINEWLANVRHPVQVHMGSDGDPFASQVYRYFMEHVPDRDSITFSIMTNGLMFCEYHTRIPRVLARLHQLEVSIDGVTQDTYEHLRLGGRWQALLKNLRRMGEKKQEHGFQWNWHMVVQEQNWREMPAMLKMAQAHGVDKMYFNRIRDWGTSLDVSSQRFHELEEFQTMRHDLARHRIAITAGLL